MFVRVFCWPESVTPLGKLAHQFIDLVATRMALKVCLLPPPGAVSQIRLDMLPPEWEPYRTSFASPIEGKYCNVVVSNDPGEWTRLWTAGVANLLLTTMEPPPLDPQHLIYHGAYAGVVVPPGDSGALYASWSAARVPVVVELPTAYSEAAMHRIRGAMSA